MRRNRYNRFKASREAEEKMLAPICDAQALNYAKEKRFTLSASLLADKPTQVRVINNVDAPPAAYRPTQKDIMLNEAWPETDNEVSRLIFNRANLYHEVDHALFTKGDLKRKKLAESSKDKDTFLAVSNILEDGRIEWLGKQKFPGSGDFLDAILVEGAKMWKADNKIEGLICYARTTMFRNESDAAYWQPYKAKIDKAIRALTTSSMLDIAFEIVEAISPDKPKQPEQPEQGEGQNEPQSGEEDTPERENGAQDETSNDSDTSDTSDDDDESDNDGSESDDEGSGEAEGDGSEQSESDDEARDDDEGESTSASNSKRGEEKPSDIDGDVWEKIKQIAAQAMDNVKAEAQADLQAILDEAETYEPEQGYLDGNESGSADELASIFSSLAVESARVRYQSSRAGLLNSASLASALTDRRCFHKREETPSVPNVVLLLDTSSSMDASAGALTSAARVLNGALRKAKINVKVITFGGFDGDPDGLKEFKTLPVDAPLYTNGGTPTGAAMRAANDWLESQASTRGLIIVATDGQPNDAASVANEVQRGELANSYVVGVLIGIDAEQVQRHDENVKAHEALMASLGQKSRIRASYSDTLCKQFHEFAFCPNIAGLANIIQPMLASYLAGS